MRLPRLSIRMLMIIVGVLALDFAAVRFLLDDNYGFLVAAVPSGLALHVGLLLIHRSRGRVRAFLIGFVASGLMAMMSLVWAEILIPPACPPFVARTIGQD